jgi:hypothetical protein
MTVDKSIRQWYASGLLVKKGPPGTRPGFRYGPHSGPSGPSAPSGGHHGGGGGRDAPTRSAPAPAPSPHRPDPVPTRPVTTAKAPPSILTRETKPAMLGDTGGSLPKPKIDTGPKRDMHDFEIKKRKTIDITGGNPFIDDVYEKKIVYEPSDLPKRAYDPRTDPNALLKRPSGIGGILKGVGMALLPGLLPAKLAAGLATYNQAKMISSAAKKFGITDKDVVQTLTSKVLDKDIRKQILKDDIPKVADRHPGTSKKKKTTVREDKDGPNQILPENLQSTVSEGTQQFLSDEMKEQYKVAQNKMKAALSSGYYTDQDGKQIQLSDEQVDALTQWVAKIDGMLIDPVTMADGGRVDKALGGRVRDI